MGQVQPELYQIQSEMGQGHFEWVGSGLKKP